jgi:capsular exopolysaccharide synthesis family protein
MEYVKTAIEKARQDKEKSQAQSKQIIDSAESSVKPEFADDDAISIDYSQTRSVSINNRVLVENRVVAAFDSDERAEPYRHLRTQVLKAMRDNKWRTLAITSAHRDAGKTLTAVNLAIAIAKEVNQTVLLVDVDLKDPSISDVLGLEAKQGVVEHLKGEVSLQDILVNPGLDRLTVLPSLPVGGVTSELLSSPRMKSLLNDIISRYSDRLIIFDLPPLLRDDDALVFTPYVDTTLLVVESGATTPDELERCVQLLRGTHILGTILNKAS